MLGAIAIPALLLAHTALRRSEPASGAHLTEVPRRLVLEFTEVIALATARVILRGPAGDTIPLAALRHSDSTRHGVTAELVGMPRAGAHTVEWTVAGTDGHPVRGTFGFTIDTTAAGLAAPVVNRSTTDSAGPGVAPVTRVTRVTGGTGGGATRDAWDASAPLPVAVRFLGFAAILGVIGALTLGLVVVPRVALANDAGRVVIDTARRFGLASAVALLVCAVARLVLQTLALHGSWDMTGARHALSGSVWGIGWQLQAAGALVAAVLLGIRSRASLRYALIPALAIVVSASLSGHPVAVPGAAPLAVTLDAIHILAAGGWLGALAVVVPVVMPGARVIPRDARPEILRRLLIGFTPVALASAALLVLSGAIGAWLQMGGISPLFASGYGRLLLLKIAVLFAIAGLGMLNWRRIVPGIASDEGVTRLRASAGAELTLAVVALLVTAILTATTPPISGTP